MSQLVMTPEVPLGHQALASQSSAEAGLGRVALWACALLVLGSSVFRGGNRFVPLIGIEWVSLTALLAMAFAYARTGMLAPSFGRGKVFWAKMLLLSAPVWIGILQIVPWPFLGTTSVMPTATWGSVLAGIPLMVMFMAGLVASPRQLHLLCTLWALAAVLQAALGIAQLGDFKPLNFGLETMERVRGTFASKNTYTNFLVMCLPLVLLRVLSDAPDRGESSNRHPWLWGQALFILMIAMVASTSRAGIATGILSLLLSLSLLYVPREGVRSYRSWLFAGLALGLVVILTAGGMEWLTRFEAENLLAADAVRALNRSGTWQGAMDYWPMGVGMGAFIGVFPKYQAPELGYYLIDLAHSDYLHFLMEAGLAAALVLAIATTLVARRILDLAQMPTATRQSRRVRVLIAAGLGVLSIALHAWVDYPMHIPANAMLGCFLLGIFLRELDADMIPTPKARKRSRTL